MADGAEGLCAICHRGNALQPYEGNQDEQCPRQWKGDWGNCYRLGYEQEKTARGKAEVLIESWRQGFERVCDAVFPESVGRGRLISWEALARGASDTKSAHGQAQTAISIVSGALADAGMAVGPAVEFGARVAELAKERDHARALYRIENGALIALDGAVAHAIQRVEKVEKERDEAQRRRRWYEAAHILLANEHAFIAPKECSPFFMMAGVFADGQPALAVNVNDVFYWGTADAESFEYIDAPAMLEILKRDGFTGLVAWVMAQRLARGDADWDERHLRKYTPDLSLLEQRDAARAQLAAVLDEADAKAWTEAMAHAQHDEDGWTCVSRWLPYHEAIAAHAAAALAHRLRVIATGGAHP